MKYYIITIKALQFLEKQKLGVREILKILFKKYNLNEKERRIATRLTIETVRNWFYVNYIINWAVYPRKIEDLDSFIRNLLRLGVYLIKVENQNPKIITKKLVSLGNNEKRRGFINAVLRKIENFDEDLPPYILYSHPKFFFDKIKELIGEKEAIKLIQTNQNGLPTYIRVNTLKIDPDQLRKKLEIYGYIIEETFLWDFLKVKNIRKPLPNIPEYEEGLFRIQDLASGAVSHILNPEPDSIILDMCAAPGSKTTHLAQLMENTGKIFAVEKNPRRAKKIKNSLKKYGITNVEVIVGDALKIEGKFDYVLLDPPCSSSGTYARFPEMKIFPVDLNQIVNYEKKFLEKLRDIEFSLGVYSVCSLFPEEGEELIEKFDFKLIREKFGSKGYKKYKIWKKVHRFFPHVHGTNGFFVAKFEVG